MLKVRDWMLIFAFALAVMAHAGAAELPAADGSDPVAATVNGEPIKVSEVMKRVKMSGKETATGGELAVSQAEELGQLIGRLLVEQGVKKAGVMVDDKEIDTALDSAAKALAGQNISTEELQAKLKEARASFASQVLWQKYLKSKITDAALEAYYNAHRSEFDGTQVRVSHILLRPQRPADPIAISAKIDEAKQIRDQIDKGEISFADAAKKYSSGPSSAKGGDLGKIPRHGVMVEDFSKAAFALKKGEISQPVVTPFGVHLIQATDIESGKKPWGDAREEIAAAVAQELYEKMATSMQDQAKIEFTGALPHFKPGTKNLVPAKK